MSNHYLNLIWRTTRVLPINKKSKKIQIIPACAHMCVREIDTEVQQIIFVLRL